MRTITKLEESDIELEDNPIHETIIGTLTVYALMINLSADRLQDKEYFQKLEREGVAVFLNALEEKGFTIVKKEIPNVFTD